MASLTSSSPNTATAGAWGGEFDTLADVDERRVFFAALDSFR